MMPPPRFDSLDLLEALPGIAYLADPAGTVIAYGARNWNRFALENGAPHLARADAVLGKNVLGFAHTETVRAIYARFLETLRKRPDEPITFSFPCDAPDLRRDMRMTLSALRTRGTLVGVLFHSVPLLVRPLIEISAVTRGRVTQCSFCRRVQRADGRWVAAGARPLVGAPVNHGLCPACQTRWEKDSLPSPALRLSGRQRQILALVAQGRTNSSIAIALDVSENTIKSHLREILTRLGAANRTQATRIALRLWPELGA